MCGRMTSTTTADEIAKQFEAELITKEAENLPASYNVASTQDIMVIANHKDDGRVLETMHWGLVPFFAKDKKTSGRMINARAESVPDKPAYRRAFTKHRCVIPADGFFAQKTANLLHSLAYGRFGTTHNCPKTQTHCSL
jgi:putative SOS response-associated peptidase YedK